MTLTARIGAIVDATFIGSGDLGNPSVDIDLNTVFSLASGTDTTDKADLIFADQRQLAASGTEDLTLDALTDLFGGTFDPAEIVAVAIQALPGNTNNVLVGNASADAWAGPVGATGVVTLKPGAAVLFTDKLGWAVAASAKLKVANSAAGSVVNYKIILVGRSVAA